MPDAAIHHVARRHHVRSRFRVGKRGLAKKFQGRIVCDFFSFNHPAMAVAHVFAQANVGDQRDMGKSSLNFADGILNDTL